MTDLNTPADDGQGSVAVSAPSALRLLTKWKVAASKWPKWVAKRRADIARKWQILKLGTKIVLNRFVSLTLAYLIGIALVFDYKEASFFRIADIFNKMQAFPGLKDIGIGIMAVSIATVADAVREGFFSSIKDWWMKAFVYGTFALQLVILIGSCMIYRIVVDAGQFENTRILDQFLYCLVFSILSSYYTIFVLGIIEAVAKSKEE